MTFLSGVLGIAIALVAGVLFYLAVILLVGAGAAAIGLIIRRIQAELTRE